MDDTDDENRGFARVQPVAASPGIGRFMAALRRLQDIAVSTNPDEILWNDGTMVIEDISARLEEYKAPAGVAPAGRARDLPGNGHPMLPPRQVAAAPDEVTMLPKAIVFRPVIERSPAGKADYRWAREQAVSGGA